MKTCAECQSPAPDALLACSACGGGIFTEPSAPIAEKHADSDFVALLKWSIGYVVSAVLIGVVTSMAAHMLWRNGFRAAAEGMATSPIMLIPVLTMLFFALYPSRYRNPIVRAGALYLAISVLGLGVFLLSSGRPAEYIAAAASTLFFGLIGTAIAFFFRRKNDEA